MGGSQAVMAARTWKSTLLPGFPQDQTNLCARVAIAPFSVANDPTVRAWYPWSILLFRLVLIEATNDRERSVRLTFQAQNNKCNGVRSLI